MNKDNIVSLRLKDSHVLFLDAVKGSKTHTQIIRALIEWLEPYGVDYARSILRTNESILQEQNQA